MPSPYRQPTMGHSSCSGDTSPTARTANITRGLGDGIPPCLDRPITGLVDVLALQESSNTYRKLRDASTTELKPLTQGG